MNDKSPLRIQTLPELRDPLLIAAFGGWSDAGEAATFAISALVRAWRLVPCASIDHEDFYVYTETRPTIGLASDGSRTLTWPSNQFYGHILAGSERDILLLLGVEPDLHWQTFCRAVLELAHAVDASALITLGALLADVPHTAAVPVGAYLTDPIHVPEYETLGIGLSTYEGPTGILGVLHEAWRRTGKPGISLWGSVPHYISAVPNPEVSLALLRRLSGIVGIDLPTRRIEARAQGFRSRIDEALADNPEAIEYVRQLEEQYETESPAVPSRELIQELEEYLRIQRPDPNDDVD